ncbi:DUF5060 domain-containing protein [Algisphaera agarilytica]|uniref:DUF5060 domain-containing protein n=1 Tax=Algisphaera agarilytica TaxID=1385975 RepID=A0A7X0LL44_9BACT|nr:DUF5060 domain-containing protein [Algisphaera agarilytica]MBB6431115.1 hypothetical protein [Algisphaera agarilytica]
MMYLFNRVPKPDVLSLCVLVSAVVLALATTSSAGENRVMIWHAFSQEFQGPETSESATPNPFTDYRLDVTFTNGEATYVVPGYFAADGDAANTSADNGNVWRVHFLPDALGEWTWSASFRSGEGVAMADGHDAGESAGHFDAATGSFTVIPSDKTAPDFRAIGRLAYVGERYPRTLGDGKVFFKAGADSPENFLSYADFDGNFKSDGHKDQLVKTWEPHVRDWSEGDPSWQDGKGKGIIGAINYLSSKGLNSVSMLTMNIGGDDRNVFMYVDYDDYTRIDVSRVEQWRIVVEHAATKGLFVHFKTQETENETLLDNGETGPDRKLYYRELVARFAHLPALNWNMGEENGEWGKHHHKEKYQTTEQRFAMARHIKSIDPYQHPVVMHNGQWPNDVVGADTPYDGWSLQTAQPDFRNVHKSTLNILKSAESKGKIWMVACDEPGDAMHAVKPDDLDPDHFDARTNALWGNFLAGGWGVEWYYGYKNPHSDLSLQDHRSRNNMYEQSAHALHFWYSTDLPVNDMKNHNALLRNADGFCLALPGVAYVALVKDAGKPAQLDLTGQSGTFSVQWYNPRAGGALQAGSADSLNGGDWRDLGAPPADADKDWVVLIKAE